MVEYSNFREGGRWMKWHIFLNSEAKSVQLKTDLCHFDNAV